MTDPEAPTETTLTAGEALGRARRTYRRRQAASRIAGVAAVLSLAVVGVTVGISRHPNAVRTAGGPLPATTSCLTCAPTTSDGFTTSTIGPPSTTPLHALPPATILPPTTPPTTLGQPISTTVFCPPTTTTTTLPRVTTTTSPCHH